MKPQKPGSNNRYLRKIIPFLPPGLFLAGLLVLSSCKNDIEYINMLSTELDMPIQTGKNFEVQYTDSGRLQVIFKAPLVELYSKSTEKGEHYEFKDGIEIRFFNKKGVLESTITARYGEYWEEKSLGYARDSVVGKNVINGEELNTEELYWNRETGRIYSYVFTKITNDEGVFYGEEGFESDQDFSNYKLIGSRGTVNVEDEELP